jgi:hypothetical protein
MTPSVLYRLAAALLVLFALGHQFGFRSVDPTWNANAVVSSMQAVSFPVQGFTRTYWDFFSGFGFMVTLFFLFSAVLSWELARLPADTRTTLARSRWVFALSYVVVAIVSWVYFFVVPGAFATIIAASLIMGAMRT